MSKPEGFAIDNGPGLLSPEGAHTSAPASLATLRQIAAAALALSLAGAPLVAGGCNPPTNPLQLEILVDVNDPPPTFLKLTIFDPHGEIVAAAPVPVSSIESSLLVGGLPGDTLLRVAMVGGPTRTLGGTRAEIPSGAQSTENIMLSSTTADADGDEIPDSIDNCPTVFNPEQLDAAGDGTGDACRGLDLAVPRDGGHDLATTD
jgi:hypothetical protein